MITTLHKHLRPGVDVGSEKFPEIDITMGPGRPVSKIRLTLTGVRNLPKGPAYVGAVVHGQAVFGDHCGRQH